MVPCVPDLPDDSRWQRVTTELLATDEGDDLRGIIDGFEPLDNKAGREMAGWLKEVSIDSPPAEHTYVLRTDDVVLGFFAGVTERVEFSHGVWPIIELRARIRDRRPQRALLLAAIARSQKGGARIRASWRLRCAVAIGQANKAVVILVEPDNRQVGAMWRERYGLRPKAQTLERRSASTTPPRSLFRREIYPVLGSHNLL